MFGTIDLIASPCAVARGSRAQRRRGVGNCLEDDLDLVLADPRLLEQLQHRGVCRGLEADDADLLASQVLDRLDVAVARHPERAVVAAVVGRRDDLDRQALSRGCRDRSEVEAGELLLVADDVRNRVGWHARWDQVDVNALLLVQTLVMGDVRRGEAGDLEGPEVDLDRIGARRGVASAA
jgi:hypothetical protein